MNKELNAAIKNNFNADNLQGVLIRATPEKRLAENYVSKDPNWKSKAFSGELYINASADTYERLLSHYAHHDDPDYQGQFDLPLDRYPGFSGFFTNEESASRAFTAEGEYDSVTLSHLLQQAPYYDEEAAESAQARNQTYTPSYCNHLICLRVNPQKLREIYGTDDFFAAQSVCTENTAWGEGGGFQGYNPMINQMINEGVLEFVPQRSRLSHSTACTDYLQRKAIAREQAAEVNAYITENGIEGKEGQRLGYNELRKKKTPAGPPSGPSSGASSPGLQPPGRESILQLGIFAGLLLGFVVTYFLCRNGNLLHFLLWLITAAGPFAILLILCIKLDGFPKALCKKSTGIILTIIFALLLILVPVLVVVMFFVYLALGVLVFLKGAEIFGPTGILTITRTDEHGRTTQETRAVYGDMDSEVSRATQELKSEGYSDIRQE